MAQKVPPIQATLGPVFTPVHSKSQGENRKTPKKSEKNMGRDQGFSGILPGKSIGKPKETLWKSHEHPRGYLRNLVGKIIRQGGKTAKKYKKHWGVT